MYKTKSIFKKCKRIFLLILSFSLVFCFDFTISADEEIGYSHISTQKGKYCLIRKNDITGEKQYFMAIDIFWKYGDDDTSKCPFIDMNFSIDRSVKKESIVNMVSGGKYVLDKKTKTLFFIVNNDTNESNKMERFDDTRVLLFTLILQLDKEEDAKNEDIVVFGRSNAYTNNQKANGKFVAQYRPACLVGDVTLDGVITVADVTTMQWLLSAVDQPVPFNHKLMNADGSDDKKNPFAINDCTILQKLISEMSDIDFIHNYNFYQVSCGYIFPYLI